MSELGELTDEGSALAAEKETYGETLSRKRTQPKARSDGRLLRFVYLHLTFMFALESAGQGGSHL
jgi:hypothetical protein